MGSIQKMTANLYLEEAKISTENNIVISPLSIHMAMSMLYYGLKGRSRKQLRDALGLENIKKRLHIEEIAAILNDYEELDNDNITLNVANGMYVAKDFAVKPEFKSLIQTQFDAEVQSLDFCQKQNTVEIINNWAANKTNNLIQSLVTEDAIDDDTKMILVNAVYFKAKWLNPFDERHTRRQKFTTLNKVEKDVDFMYISETVESAFIKDLNATIVALPYADEDFKMIIVHPTESSSIDSMEKIIFNTSEGVVMEQFITELESKEIDLFFPKFEAGSDLSLAEHFKKMGVLDIFSEAPNLKGISDDAGNAVGDIIHKTKIEVSEEGSEAAAATTVIFTKVFKPKPKISIDSPFLFFIFDTKNNIPIFIGKITDPLDGQDITKEEETKEAVQQDEVFQENKATQYDAIVEI